MPAAKEYKCGTCQFADEFFGDCCHPESDGCKGIMKAINGCFNKKNAWYKKRKEPTEEDNK